MTYNPDRIPFDIREYNRRGSDSFDIRDFTFTEEEKKYVPYFVDMGEAVIHVDILNASKMMTLTLSVEGNCHLLDAHDGSLLEYPLKDDVEVIISPENEEENDILPDEDGIYDLRGSVLALLFDAIPKNYSRVPLKRIEKDNYVIMSEEEYLKNHHPQSNAFDALDEDDFPDQEEEKKEEK